MKKIINAAKPLQEKAELLFEKKSAFVDPFIRLYQGDGLIDAVEMLGAQKAYEKYRKKFDEACLVSDKKASLLLMNFHQKIVYQFVLKFKP